MLESMPYCIRLKARNVSSLPSLGIFVCTILMVNFIIEFCYSAIFIHGPIPRIDDRLEVARINIGGRQAREHCLDGESPVGMLNSVKTFFLDKERRDAARDSGG